METVLVREEIEEPVDDERIHRPCGSIKQGESVHVEFVYASDFRGRLSNSLADPFMETAM